VIEPGAGLFVDVLGLRTFVVEAGEPAAPTVLLVHGAAAGACSQINWHPNIAPLAEAGLRVIAVDQPGFGYTDDPPDWSVEWRVRHAVAALDVLGVERCHVVGNSVGAYLAARLALEQPRRVERLVLVSSSVLAPPGSAQAQAQARAHSEALREVEPTYDSVLALTRGTLFEQRLVTEELVRARLEMSSGPRYASMVARRSAPPAPKVTHRLGELRCPTLILWGRNDQGAASERALALLECIPGAELHVFDRCAHWVQWDQAARFNRLVSDFLLASAA
jgi:2-hydroxy-6-oxonona-2,4-dienedioate hydrolase